MNNNNTKKSRSCERLSNAQSRQKTLTGNHINLSPAKSNHAFTLCKQRVITSHSHIKPGEKLRASLAKDNTASCNRLSAKTLNTKKLRITVSTVSRRTLSLFMCHNLTFVIMIFRFFSKQGKLT